MGSGNTTSHSALHPRGRSDIAAANLQEASLLPEVPLILSTPLWSSPRVKFLLLKYLAWTPPSGNTEVLW